MFNKLNICSQLLVWFTSHHRG